MGKTSGSYFIFSYNVEDNMLGTVMQIYVAGTDTTSASTYWAFLFMCLHQDVQEKIYQEIKDVIGNV